jgi:hypothetical protein
MKIEELYHQLETASQHDYKLLFVADGFEELALELISVTDEECEYCEGSGHIVISARGQEAQCPACGGNPLGACYATLVLVNDGTKTEHVVPVSDIEIWNDDLCPCGDTSCDSETSHG